MKNAIFVALATIMKNYKKEFMIKNGIESLTDGTKAIAEKSNIGYNTLRSIESASYIPSRAVTNRLLETDVYPFNYSSFISLMAIIELIGTEMKPNCLSRALNVVSSDPDLSLLISRFYEAFDDEIIDDNFIMYRIYEHGLIRALNDYLNPIVKHRYFTKFVDDEALFPDLLRLWKQFFPDTILTIDDFKREWLHNKTSKVVLFRDSSCSELIGFYSLRPFNDYGFKCLLDGSVVTIKEIDFDKHFSPSFYESTCIYIGQIAGQNAYASSFVIAELFHQTLPILYNSKLKCLASRGVTPAGKAMMKRFDFQKAKGSEISLCYITDDWMRKHNIQHMLSFL